MWSAPAGRSKRLLRSACPWLSQRLRALPDRLLALLGRGLERVVLRLGLVGAVLGDGDLAVDGLDRPLQSGAGVGQRVLRRRLAAAGAAGATRLPGAAGLPGVLVVR